MKSLLEKHHSLWGGGGVCCTIWGKHGIIDSEVVPPCHHQAPQPEALSLVFPKVFVYLVTILYLFNLVGS